MSQEQRNRHGRELGRAWESLVERQIREAMEAGAFDDLPHQGVPRPAVQLDERADPARIVLEAGVVESRSLVAAHHPTVAGFEPLDS